MQTELGKEERYLLDRYGDNVVGLLKYGSMAFGSPHRRSVHDFWIIVRNLRAFHTLNRDFYATRLNHSSSVEKQIAANRFAPNFYFFHENGVAIKAAALSEHDFGRLCHSRMMFVKGRMQKPLRIIRTTSAINAAIRDARREGALYAVSLCPDRFTIDEFLYQLCSLSYRAEIRPEHKRAKILSIMAAGSDMFRDMYRGILAGIEHVEVRDGAYFDTRPADVRKIERKRTLGYLRRCKWSLNTLRLIWRNYRTHSAPIRYIWHKALGEFEKALKRRCERNGRR